MFDEATLRKMRGPELMKAVSDSGLDPFEYDSQEAAVNAILAVLAVQSIKFGEEVPSWAQESQVQKLKSLIPDNAPKWFRRLPWETVSEMLQTMLIVRQMDEGEVEKLVEERLEKYVTHEQFVAFETRMINDLMEAVRVAVSPDKGDDEDLLTRLRKQAKELLPKGWSL